jgi:sulfur-oxidizing protein SoxZ
MSKNARRRQMFDLKRRLLLNITEVDCQHNGETVCSAYVGVSVSKNPYLSFEFTAGAPGDDIKISRVDNKGESGSGEAKIK